MTSGDSHSAPQSPPGVQRSQSSGDVHHAAPSNAALLTPAALAVAAGAAAADAIATEDVMSQAAQHGSDDEDDKVKLQISIGLGG